MQYKKKLKKKEKSGPQQPLSAKCFGKSCCHLHSTDIPFCDELDIDGSAKVNITAAVIELEEGDEEEDDVVAALSLSFFFKRFLLRSMEATSDFKDR